jgi:5-formyltetrahydrofolate cyclo-ligase
LEVHPEIIARNELRKAALILRNSIPENKRDAFSQLIRKKTMDYLASISARFVHTYIGFQSEVGTRGIIEDLFERGITVAVPVVREKRLISSLLNDLDNLRNGEFGVPEPENIEEVPGTSIDAILIPIVAFDGLGMRLGYGKGYYDKFLQTLPLRARRIGLAFSIQEMDKIPKESHDQLINNVITEQSQLFFK